MEWLQAPFSAGALAWMRHGPSHHAQRHYEQVKITVLLGATTARWRPSTQAPWRRLSARSTSFYLGDVGAEAELAGDGQFFALLLERDYLGKRWAEATPTERSRYDVQGTSDPYLFHLGSEAAVRLCRERELTPRYVESVAHLVSVHVQERYLLGPSTNLDCAHAGLTPQVEARVLAYIQAHLDKNLSLENLAEVAGMSTSHFTKAFRQSVGETPHRFTVRRRVEYAKTLLCASDRKISLGEAAYEAGFSDQSHFTRCFRAWCGLTPGEFLRRK